MDTQEQQETQVGVPSSNGATPPAEPSPAEGRSAEEATAWFVYVHVGEGAEECPEREDGRCKDVGHYHAFCRLPNKLQINAIRDKANAAKARAIRQLRDPKCDRHLILDTDMQTLRELTSKDELIEEILSSARFRDHVEATREIAEKDEFEHIEDDQQRWQTLGATDPADRDEDEFQALTRHLDEWNEEVDRVREERQRPEREALDAKSKEELVELVRDQRIKVEAQEAWMSSYSLWEWFVGTLKPRDPAKGFPCELKYGSVENLKADIPAVVAAIEQAFELLEGGQLSQRAQNAARAEGNS